MIDLNISGKPEARKIITGLLACLAFLLPFQVLANTLTGISYTGLSGNRVQVVLTLAEKADEPNSFSTDNPSRIAIDLENTSSALKRKTQSIGVGMARSVTAIQAGSKTRVVLNLVSSVDHSIKTQGNQIIVDIGGGSGSGTSTPDSAITAASSTLPALAGHEITGIDFRRGKGGKAEIVVDLSDANTIVDMKTEGGKLVVDFLDTQLPEKLSRKLDVSDFATPVTTVETKTAGSNVRMVVEATGDYDHLAYQLDKTYVIELKALTRQQVEQLKKARKVYTGDRLSLTFQDIEVRAVLKILGEFTGTNMVISDTVQGNITLNLDNVPSDQILDLVLKTKGLAMRKHDNVIRIAPAAEIAKTEEAELKSQQTLAELAPLITELVHINYARANDIASVLNQSRTKDEVTSANTFGGTNADTTDSAQTKSSILSARGQVTVDVRTNSLLIRDTAANLANIRDLISKLDIPVRQVMIESRIVSANNDFAKNLGVKLGYESSKDGLGGSTDSFFTVSGGLGTDTGSDFNNVPASVVGATNNLVVNLPQTLSASRGGAINFILGRIGSHLLRLELNAMQQEGKGEIISSPRIITSDANPAEIRQGTQIPYQTSSTNGTNTQFVDAVLKLNVTPHITPDDRILLELEIHKDKPTVVAGSPIPAIDVQSVKTNVLVDNGETVVLGGVYEREKSNATEKVPFLGDLPVLGFLFKTESEVNKDRELLIFVTPKILKESLKLN